MSNQHTPGPWVRTHGSGRYYIKTDKQSIATVFSSNGEFGCPTNPTSKQASANARLIAAAPELLEALQEMVEVNDGPCRIDHKGFCQSHYLDHVDEGGCRIANAKAVIAKATGGAA